MREGCWSRNIGFITDAAFALPNGRPFTGIFGVLAAVAGPFPAPTLALDIYLLDRVRS